MCHHVSQNPVAQHLLLCRPPTLPAVVLNVDNSCPNSLRNQEYVKYLFQAQPKGLVTLDFKQNGDYYISCAVGIDVPATCRLRMDGCGDVIANCHVYTCTMQCVWAVDKGRATQAEQAQQQFAAAGEKP